MNNNDDVAASGVAAKVEATILEKAATISNKVSHANIENNCLPFYP